MKRRTVLSVLGSAPLACLCSSSGWAQGSTTTVQKTPPFGAAQGRGTATIQEKPRILAIDRAVGRPFCTFEHPPGSGGSGIGPRSYATKPDGGRGKSQLTWSLAGKLPGVANPAGTLANAFAAWRIPQAAPALGFTLIGGNADINISAADLGGPDASGLQVLGSTAANGSTIQFNSRFTWAATPAAGTTLLEIATHEIGHALGLLHATTANSVMYPIAQGNLALAPDDRAAIRALYGWNPQSRLEGGSEQPPALCACGGTLARAWRGTRNDSDIWFSTSTDGIGWTPQRRIPGAATAGGPSLAWDGTRLWMAWRGVDGDDDLYWANTPNFFNGNWSGVQHLGDRASSHGPRIAIAAGGPIMVWKGIPGDQGLYFARFGGGSWGSQKPIGGVGSAAAPAICQDLDPNAVRMVWRGSNGDDSLWTSTLSGPTWQPQQQVSWVITGNGAGGTTGVGIPGSADGPALTLVAGKVMAAWRGVGGDSSLWFTQLANDVVGGRTVQEWSSQATIPNTGSSRGPGLAQFNGLLHAAWKGVEGDNALWTATL